MSTIEERVKKIVVEQLGVKEEEVTNEASFVDDLGADSLDTVELVMALEEEFERKRRRSPPFSKPSISSRPINPPIDPPRPRAPSPTAPESVVDLRKNSGMTPGMNPACLGNDPDCPCHPAGDPVALSRSFPVTHHRSVNLSPCPETCGGGRRG